MAKREGFENEQEVWTPADNPSIKDAKRAGEMFPSKGGFIGILGEVKDIDDESKIPTGGILTKAAF